MFSGISICSTWIYLTSHSHWLWYIKSNQPHHAVNWCHQFKFTSSTLNTYNYNISMATNCIISCQLMSSIQIYLINFNTVQHVYSVVTQHKTLYSLLCQYSNSICYRKVQSRDYAQVCKSDCDDAYNNLLMKIIFYFTQ